MDKMSRKIDENLEIGDWMSEEYKKEADDIIQDVLSKDDVLPDDQIDVQGSYEKLVAEMKVRGIYREDSQPETKEAPEEPKKEKKQGKAARGLAKAAAFLLVVGASVFAGSMTSEANRNYLIDNINMLIGNDVQVNVTSGSDQDVADTDENEAVLDIEDKLSVGVPAFLYRPAKLKYYSYYVDEMAMNANLNYLYGDKVINLRIQVSNDEIEANIAMHGDADETIPVFSEENLEVELHKIQAKDDREPSYLAQWNIDNVYYQLSGKMDYQELRQMIEQMVMIY
ncbi:MAG TPA: DUF4367 domain-containing protein [Candidatus Blautia gallistercoris]|uniref:DUF4367 domain-containing protein n=1 Tax=Candidatus Blautia gallistercoris TaxID=2838490 RepID=A0A9D1WJ00_9FIRM|nr:DUF4367 domain-containing protein [Candidatus Blautia gallistercoris]